MKLQDLFSLEDLNKAIESGDVTRKRHDTLPLSTYCYGRNVQYENSWNYVTMACRGLIADDETGEVVALPFRKFFGTSMHGHDHAFAPAFPQEQFRIYDKVDGSMILLHHYRGLWRTATKGSFGSEQAQWAQRWVERDDVNLSALDTGVTYIAECIYPENRIVVDYGTRHDLVLLAGFARQDGTELPLHPTLAVQWHTAGIGSVVPTYGATDDLAGLEALVTSDRHMGHGAESLSGVEAEGYVIRFASGLRSKLKLNSYVALHGVLTNTSEKSIWRTLVAGEDILAGLINVPDEADSFCRALVAKLTAEHERVTQEARTQYLQALMNCKDVNSRKEFAIEAMKSPVKSALFLLHDDREDAFQTWGWKQIEPHGSGAKFMTDEEN